MLTDRDDILPLTYEALVSDPAGTLSTFLRVCGIPVRSDVIDRIAIARSPVRELDPGLDYSEVRRITDSKYQLLLQSVSRR
jgi:hypothetical protein